VRYVDPDNGWKTATEYVADDDLIRRFGLNVAKIEAFGCTSRGQAHRIGKWLIQTEKLEKQTITFAIGREGLRHLPGDIIGIADNDYAGAKIGGRIVEVNGNTVTLDRDVELSNISNAYLTYTDSKAQLVKVMIQAQPSPNQLVLADEVLADKWSVWMLIDPALKPRLFKALKISENDDGSYSVTALEHQPNKEAIVDAGAVFENDTSSAFSLAIPPVEQLQIEVMPESDRYQGRLTWSTPRTINKLQFEVKIFRGDLLISRQLINSTEYYINDLPKGNFQAVVRGVGEQGKLGYKAAIAFSIALPDKPSQILFTPSISSVAIRPITTAISSLGTQYEFYKGRTQEEVIARSYYLGRGLTMIDQDCLPDSEYWYGVNVINEIGRSDMLIANTKTLIDENRLFRMSRLQTNDDVLPTNTVGGILSAKELNVKGQLTGGNTLPLIKIKNIKQEQVLIFVGEFLVSSIKTRLLDTAIFVTLNDVPFQLLSVIPTTKESINIPAGFTIKLNSSDIEGEIAIGLAARKNNDMNQIEQAIIDVSYRSSVILAIDSGNFID